MPRLPRNQHPLPPPPYPQPEPLPFKPMGRSRAEKWLMQPALQRQSLAKTWPRRTDLPTLQTLTQGNQQAKCSRYLPRPSSDQNLPGMNWLRFQTRSASQGPALHARRVQTLRHK